MIPKVKITTLCENTAPDNGLIPEYGLAVVLERGDRRILFDTGSGYSLAPNAALLGIDLASLEAAVLSHGHQDHTGGLKNLLKKNSPLPIYAHPDIFNNYLYAHGGEAAYVGPPWDKEYLQKLGARFHFSEEPVTLEAGLIITGQVPRTVEFEKQEPIFIRRTAAGFAQDEIYDDQSLVVESPQGTVVLLGCTHAGLINTLRYVTALTGKQQIYAVLGGMHLMNVSEQRLARTLDALDEFDIELMAPNHCTGSRATAAIRQKYGEKFRLNQAGSVFTFG